MQASDSHLKFLFAFSLPPLMILLSLIGGDNWGAYRFCATVLILAGGICAASLVHSRSSKYVTAILYMVILELMLLLLP